MKIILSIQNHSINSYKIPIYLWFFFILFCLFIIFLIYYHFLFFYFFFFFHLSYFYMAWRTCVGRGNRRLYLIFLVLSALFLSHFFILSLSSHYHGICEESAGPRSPGFFSSASLIFFSFFHIFCYALFMLISLNYRKKKLYRVNFLLFGTNLFFIFQSSLTF